MPTIDPILRQKILISVQRALLGRVTPTLRGVSVDWIETDIRLNFYFHKALSDDDREELNCAHTEVVADFIDIAPVDFAVFQVDAPKEMIGPEKVVGPDNRQANRAWAFLRKDDDCQERWTG